MKVIKLDLESGTVRASGADATPENPSQSSADRAALRLAEENLTPQTANLFRELVYGDTRKNDKTP